MPQGRTIVITGAASGIGKALALGFLRDGARVVAADIRPEGLAEVESAGGLVRELDVADARGVRDLIELAKARYSGTRSPIR